MLTEYEKRVDNERNAAIFFQIIDEYVFKSYFQKNRDHFNYSFIFKLSEDKKRKELTAEFLQSEQGSALMLHIPETWIKADLEDKLDQLAHELVHIKNLFEGIKDSSRGGRYHNIEFKKAADVLGLICEDLDKVQGYSHVELSKEQRDSLMFTDIANIVFHDTERVKKPFTNKYICKGCGTTFHVKRGLNLICGKCMQTFTEIKE